MIRKLLTSTYKSLSRAFSPEDTAPFLKSLMMLPDKEIAYVRVPKAGCSTVISRLLGDEGQKGDGTAALHSRNKLITYDDANFRNRMSELSVSETKAFSVVRNPYTRILSAYREKIELMLDGAKFRDELGISERKSISFEEFVNRIVDIDPIELDMHFMPQSLIVRADMVRYSKIFHIEEMTECLLWLDKAMGGRAVSNHKSVAPHATNATKLTSTLYTPKTINLVAEYYKKDFLDFGYRPDIEAVGSHSDPKNLGMSSISEIKMGWFNALDSRARTYVPLLLHRHK